MFKKYSNEKESKIPNVLASVLISILLFFNVSAKAEEVDGAAYLSEFETFLPNASVNNFPRYEKKLLIRYLNNPQDGYLAKLLAYTHLSYSLSYARNKNPKKGKSIKHAILAQYFLQRSRLLDGGSYWLDYLLEKNKARLDLFDLGDAIPVDGEQRPAHKYFRQAFHFKEKNRYKALNRLLNEYTIAPDNVYTVFTITAINLWIGGEADDDDPTALYNAVLGSYFSEKAISYARRLETMWLLDPASAQRFRMSSILGGFSLLQRRWLAVLHKNDTAVEKIDDEHREWRLVNRAFHAFTLGIPFFEIPESFQEGKFAIEDGFLQCVEEPDVRTCLNRPRFSYNLLGFILTLIDFNIKDGDLQTAQGLLQYRFNPAEAENWAAWDLGREAWLHREQNFADIAALYQNDVPEDDPIHFQIKPRKWSMNTTTCQTCHQVQGRDWTDEEFNTVLPASESVATIGSWPTITTTWWAEEKTGE